MVTTPYNAAALRLNKEQVQAFAQCFAVLKEVSIIYIDKKTNDRI